MYILFQGQAGAPKHLFWGPSPKFRGTGPLSVCFSEVSKVFILGLQTTCTAYILKKGFINILKRGFYRIVNFIIKKEVSNASRLVIAFLV